MRGNEIVVMGPWAKGVKKEGTIDDTSYPGTAMQITPGSAFVNGRPHYEHYQPSADGDPRVKIILNLDYPQGGQANQAYVSGSHCYVYYPLPGEDINICVASQVGTGSANAYTIGERLIPAHATGQFIAEATSSFNAWFMSMEHLDVTADSIGWLWCETQ